MPSLPDTDAQRELIRTEISRADPSQDRVFQMAATLAAVAVAAGFVLFGRGSSDLPDWALLLVGTVPLLLAGIYIVQVALTIIADYYIRLLEKAYPPHSEHELHGFAIPRRPMFRHLIASMVSPKGASRSVASLIYLVGCSAAIAAIGLSVATTLQMDSPWWQLVGALIGLVVMVYSLRAAITTVRRGRRSFAYIYAFAELDAQHGLEPRPKVRPEFKPLGKYLLLPRPYEFLMKAISLHLPAAGLGVAILSVSPGGVDWWAVARTAVLLVFSFEFFLYQVRYMVNDWDGRQSEVHNVFRSARGRPQLVTGNTHVDTTRAQLFWTAAVLRVGAGVGVAFLCLDGWFHYGVLLATMLLATVAYEALRVRTKTHRLKQRTSQAMVAWGILLVATLGYGARLWAGVVIGSSGLADSQIQVLAVLSGCALGFVGVVMAWTMYGDAYTKVSQRSVQMHRLLESNIHYAWLASVHHRSVTATIVPWRHLKNSSQKLSDAVVRSRATERIAMESTARSFLSLRMWSGAIAIGFATAFWIAASPSLGLARDLPLTSQIAFVALGAITGGFLVAGQARHATALVLLCVSAGGLAGLHPLALVMTLPFAASLITIATLRTQTYEEFVDPWTHIRRKLKASLTRLHAAFRELER